MTPPDPTAAKAFRAQDQKTAHLTIAQIRKSKGLSPYASLSVAKKDQASPSCPTLASKIEKTEKKILSPAPKAFIKSPLFAVKSREGERAVQVGDSLWTIGVEHPVKRWSNKWLNIKHGKICFTLLSFWKEQNYARSLFFSMGELCRRYSSGEGKSSRYYREILGLLFDLRDTWVRIKKPDGTEEVLALIGDIKLVKDPQNKLFLERVDLSPEFFRLLGDLENIAHIRLDVLNAIPSPIAAALYTFLPSRAFYHSAKKPFQIALKNLLIQIGIDPPENKSRRKQIFTQNAQKKSGSILQQLNQLPVYDGVLRVELVPLKDGDDFKLMLWVENKKDFSEKQEQSAYERLLKIWRKFGGNEVLFAFKLKQLSALDPYEEALLHFSAIDIDKQNTFLEYIKALIGVDHFRIILAEAKDTFLSKKTSKQKQQVQLVYRLLQSVAQKAQQTSNTLKS